MKIEVLHAANVRAGDVVAGTVDPTRPTRPVSDHAAATTVLQVSEVPAATYTFHYSDDGVLMSEPYGPTDQIIVIRGAVADG